MRVMEPEELARSVAVGAPGLVLRCDSEGRNRFVRWPDMDGDAEVWSVYRGGRMLGVVVRGAEFGEGWRGVAVGGRSRVRGCPSRYEAGRFLASVAGLGTVGDDDGGDAA